MSKLTHRQRAIIAIEGGQPDYVPTFELAFQLTEEAFGESFFQGPQHDALSEADRKELCRRNAALFLQIAERYDHSIIMLTIAPSSVFPQRSQELVWTMQAIREAARAKGEDYLIVTHGDATFGLPAGRELEELIGLMADDPERLKPRAERMLYEVTGHYLYYALAGFDGFALCADHGFNTSTFFSPEQFRLYVAPYLARLVATYRGLEKYVIKHSDGNIMVVFDQLVACRPHAIHSLDPQCHMDIAEIKRLYGRQVALCGNVNCGLMQTGTDDEVLASCEYAMRHGKPGGGFVFCTSNCAFKGMPLARYELMNRYWREHRAYGS